jgi:RNA polymerase sigma factor (sigma-70 family)
MKPGVDLRTRQSLIERVKNPDDQRSWNEFFEIYSPLLYNVALRSGLSEADAEDAVQDTLLTIASRLPHFRYDPAVGSFKGWLKQLARSRVVDRWRRERKHREGALSIDHSDGDGFPLAGPLPSGHNPEFDSIWEEQWKRDLFAAALDRVRTRIRARDFQIFHLCEMKGLSVAAAAKVVQLQLHQVYFARKKVIRLIQAEVKRLERAETVSPG